MTDNKPEDEIIALAEAPRKMYRALISFDDVRPMQGHVDIAAIDAEHAKKIVIAQAGARQNFVLADIHLLPDNPAPAAVDRTAEDAEVVDPATLN
jgi:hypothetical protein